MDAKERCLIEHLYRKLQSASFADRDVLLLLILLRRHANQNSLLREFGDFVAHRERDRGILQQYVLFAEAAFQGGAATRPKSMEQPWTAHDIGQALSTSLVALGLEPVGADLANYVTVCIICLLQSVRITTGASSKIGRLVVGISSTFIALYGQACVPAGHVFAFPLLIATNDGYEASLAQVNVDSPIFCDRIVEAYCSHGRFYVEQRAAAA